jgi:tryptophan halogenase
VGRFRRARAEDRVIAVELVDGSEITADLWLDCSGPAALLAGRLDPGWEDWSAWLPCDCVAARWNPMEGVPPPYAHAGAFAGGWQHVVPLPGGQSNALFYASRHLGEQPHGVEIGQGRLARAWTGNVVALGAAAMLVEPLHGWDLTLLQNALDRLIGLLPATPHGPEPAEYNRLFASEADRVRDFAILHYKTNGRAGDPLWDEARAMAVPDTLQHKLDLYASRGRVPIYDEELFEAEEWIAVLDGQGARPRRYDVLADSMTEAQLLAHAARVREVILDAARSMPPYGATLRSEGLVA